MHRDYPPIPDRHDVIRPVVGEPAQVLAEPRRSHYQDHLVPGGDDRFKLGPQAPFGLLAYGLIQFVAAVADPWLRIRRARINVSPFQVRVNEVHHARDIAPVVGQESLADDPFVLVTHLEPSSRSCPSRLPMSGVRQVLQAGLSGTLAWPLHRTILLRGPFAGYPSAKF